jgi:hypothetical protein
MTMTRSVLVRPSEDNGQHTSRPEFVRMLAESIELMLAFDPTYSGIIDVTVYVDHGVPTVAAVGRRETPR